MKKLLYIENNASIKATNFYMSSAMAAKKCGIEFHLAYNAHDATDESVKELFDKYGVYFHQIDFIRRPYDPGNIRAYRQVVKLLKTKHFDIIHCNTPIGGVVGRLAGKRCGIKTIIYQAHGFHFYKGAPLLNWLIYYPIEKWLAHYTDILITINREDSMIAENKMHLRKNGQVKYVPGVGIDISKLGVEYQKQKEINKDQIVRNQKKQGLTYREYLYKFGIPEDACVLISVGELNKNKNNQVVFKAIKKLNNKSIHYILCGSGIEQGKLEKLAQRCGVSEQIHFLGYRADAVDLMKGSDIFVLSSYREGLSRALMEAMACGLPCIASKIRGNTDLINEKLLCIPDDIAGFAKIICQLVENKEYRVREGCNNIQKIVQYDIRVVENEIRRIYEVIV